MILCARQIRGLSVRIAICGAGIGGLATASLLADAGHDVTVFERFDVPRPVGSGLVIQPVGLAVLDRIGAGEAARGYGARIGSMLGHAGGRKVLDVLYRADAPGLAMHRAALFDVLWQAVTARQVRIVTGAPVASAPLAGPRRVVSLADGTEHGPFDMVVDASGTGSPLSPLKARALPYGAIWGTVAWPDATPLHPDQLRQTYRAANRMVGILPVGTLPGETRPQAAVFWSMPAGAYENWRATPLQDWKAEAEHLWPDIAPFLAKVTHHDQMTPARYTHGTLRTPYAPVLAIIGDAAHRASPQLGQGANMALLDAFALAESLTAALRDGGGIAEALPRYGAARRWHIRAYQAMSRLFTPMYQSDSRTLPVLRDRILAPVATWPIARNVLTALVSGDMLPPVAGTRFP